MLLDSLFRCLEFRGTRAHAQRPSPETRRLGRHAHPQRPSVVPPRFSPHFLAGFATNGALSRGR
jgi:hypothetical protein